MACGVAEPGEDDAILAVLPAGGLVVRSTSNAPFPEQKQTAARKDVRYWNTLRLIFSPLHLEKFQYASVWMLLCAPSPVVAVGGFFTKIFKTIE